ncbi:MAG: universal stress protein [Pseudomonadota bacterium]
MSRIRRSSEEGHKRKFLVVVDDTSECERALYFASRRAKHSGGALALLHVIPPGDFQHWMGVEEIMRQEAVDTAEDILTAAKAKAERFAGIGAETIIREGNAAEEIKALVDSDEDIAILVLGAGTDKDGPGPLVSLFANRGASAFSIPVTVVPGTLTDDEIEALS